MAGRDSHVRPIRQKNGGLSAARTLNGSCENFVPDKKRLTKRTKNAIFFFINARKKSVRRFRHPESRGLLKTRYGSAACCRF